MRIWSTRITIIATTTSCTMMRTRLGIVFLRRERMRLEMPVTTESAITRAPFIVTVTASEEQIPRTRTVMGLPLNIGLRIVSLSFAFIV